MAGAHLIAIPYGDAPALLGTNFGQQSTPLGAPQPSRLRLCPTEEPR